MACTCPLYRLDCKLLNAQARLPERFYKRIKYDAIIMNYMDYCFLVNVHHLSKSLFCAIPCGQCIDCRLDKAREWSIRCMLESKYHKDNYFLTITYADEFVPLSFGLDTLLGVQVCNMTLKKEDIQLFNKRLRRYYDYHYNLDDVRFFLGGEYSPVRQRPHYHGIYFNLPIFDLKYWGLSRGGFPLWYSPTINNIWDKGLVFIGKVTQDACSYTAQYSMKKLIGKGKEERDSRFKRLTPETAEIIANLPAKEDEFCLMSRKPGIGRAYYDDNKFDIYKNDELVVGRGNGSAIALKPVTYYDKLFDIDEPEQLALIKEKRKQKRDIAEHLEMQTNLTSEEIKIVRANKSIRNIKKRAYEI